MKQKLFVYPTGGRGPAGPNPYVHNMKIALSRYFELVTPIYSIKLPRMLVFLLNCTKCDLYILNWIEDSAAGRGGIIGALMSLISLCIIKLRGAKLIWVFHNIHPHSGETFWSHVFRRFLFKYSSVIISHSREAAKYAQQYAKCQVLFKHHPMKIEDYGYWEGTTVECDFFFWSKILPYKGVPEFLSNPLCRKLGRKIFILGKCDDDNIIQKINQYLNDNIIFENREASFPEIAAQCKKAKYVIFPYIGDSISSSGVLMDTLIMGGTPVGPNRGAFADLVEYGCCITYDNIDDIFYYPLEEEHRMKLAPQKVKTFIDANTWEAFGNWIMKTLDQ